MTVLELQPKGDGLILELVDVKGSCGMDERREQLRSIVQGASAAVNLKLAELKRFFLVRGALAAVLGICALFWPRASLGTLIMLVGVFILADGVTGLVGAIRNWVGSETLLQPVVSLVIGLALLIWQQASLQLLLVALGAWTLAFGVGEILEARQIPKECQDRTSVLSLGWIAAALGLILIFWPVSGVVAISWIIATAAFLVAALLFFLALRTRRFQNRLTAFAARRNATAGAAPTLED